jgi:hypothetical protein
MINADLAISVGIWGTGVGMSAIGIEMTINPPTNITKWWFRAIFIALGLAFVGLSIWQFARTEREDKRKTIEHEQEQLRNEGNLKFMQGQLYSIQSIVADMSKSGLPGLKEFAAAVTKALSQERVPGPTKKELCARALAVASHLRDMQSRYRVEDGRASDQTFAAMVATKTPEERSQIWSKGQQIRSQIDSRYEYELGQTLGEIIYVKDALKEKLPAAPEPDLEVRVVFQGHLAGADPLTHAANYFDVMARKLCP